MNMEVESREHHPHPNPEVTITIDNKKYEVRPGKISVADLKQLGGISPAYELEEIIDGKLVPLKDDQHVEIKGGEHFVGHPRAGASS
jgi:hypothetical protein